MTVVAARSPVPRPFPPVHRPAGSRFLRELSAADPRVSGLMYIPRKTST